MAIDKNKSVSMVALKPDDWQKIVNYITDINVPFLKADKAVEVLRIISEAKGLNVVIEGDE